MKKGFTLVELLAVIVILSVILVIAVPKINSTISSTKESAFIAAAKLIAKSAETEYKTREMLNTLDQVNDPIECADVSNTTEDYSKCKIRFDNGVAKVDLNGTDKFEGLKICDGTKDESAIDDGKSRCNLPSEYQEVEYIESTGHNILIRDILKPLLAY